MFESSSESEITNHHAMRLSGLSDNPVGRWFLGPEIVQNFSFPFNNPAPLK